MAISPYIPIVGFKPLTQITPFTYRDGATFAEIMNYFEQWLKKVGAELQESLDEYLENIGATEQKWQDAFDEFMANVISILEGLNDQAAANLVRNPESQLRGALDELLDDWGTENLNLVIESLNTFIDATIQHLGKIDAELNGRLSEESLKTYYLDLRKMGAVGNGVADDTAILQDAFSRTGHTVIMGASGAVYRSTAEIVVTRNTEFNGNGCTIRREHQGYLLMNGNRGDTYAGYNGHGNIHLHDVILDHNGALFPGVGSTLAFAHAQDITLERVTVRDATSHGYELNSQKNVRVNDCVFEGYTNPDGNSYVEAIQLDLAVQGGFGAFGAYDATPCTDVRITNTVFRASAKRGAHPRGIGSHGSRVDMPHTDIVIQGCTFQDHASLAIRPYNWNLVAIDNCHASNPGGFLQANTPILGNGDSDNTKNAAGVQTGSSVSTRGLAITNCTSEYGGGIWLAGQATGRIRDVVIIGNRLNDIASTGDNRGVTGAYVDGVQIQGNSISGFQIGIGFLADNIEYRMRIADNDIRYCFAHGIYCSQFRQLSIVGNQTYNCGNNSDTGSHIRVSGNTVRAQISHNSGYINGDYPCQYGVYCASDNTHMVIDANIYASVGSTATMVIPSVATIVDSNNVK